jgi:hypothetical protein
VLGLMNCVYGLMNLTLGQSEFILGIKDQQRNKPLLDFQALDSTRLATGSMVIISQLVLSSYVSS